MWKPVLLWPSYHKDVEDIIIVKNYRSAKYKMRFAKNVAAALQTNPTKQVYDNFPVLE